jgi:hypothetical protein
LISIARCNGNCILSVGKNYKIDGQNPILRLTYESVG